jgi:hypothetical protein
LLVKSTVQSKFLGQLQQRIAGPLFLGGKDLEIFCGALRNDIASGGSLQQFELLKSQAGNAAVGGTSDFALLAIGRAEEADRITAVALDFEMKGKRFAFNGHPISIFSSKNKAHTKLCMATHEIRIGCGSNIEAVLA